MGVNVTSFEIEVNKFGKEVTAEFVRNFRKFVILLADKIINRTPVDTGRLRATWELSDSDPGDDAVNSVASDMVKFSPGLASQIAKSKVKMKLDEINPDNLPGLVYLFNNLVYAEPIEYGHSKQAPEGMVRVAVAEMETLAQWI